MGMNSGEKLVECSSCGSMTPSSGVVCDQCGGALAEAVALGVSPNCWPGTANATGLAGTANATGLGVLPKNAVQSYCEDLAVEYNRSSVFVCGMTLTFDFKIKPLVDNLDNLAITIEFVDSAGKLWQNHKPLHWKPMKGVSRTAGVNFQPGLFGVVSFSVYISYCRDGKQRVFGAEVRHRIYPADSRAEDVLEKIIVNINNEINTGHAADVNVRQSLDELQSLKKRVDHKAPIRDFIDAILSKQAFCLLALYPSNWTPPQAFRKPVKLKSNPPQKAVASKLTLIDGKRRIHFIANNLIKIGKKRGCDLVTRIFDDSGIAHKTENQRISRQHCRIELRPAKCLVFDGRSQSGSAAEKPSAWGTFIDGRRVSQSVSSELPLNRNSVLTLAGSDPDNEFTIGLDVLPMTCSQAMRTDCGLAFRCMPNALSSVIIRRKDQIDEIFVLLNTCCLLSAIDPSFNNMYVWKQDGAFAFCLNGKTEWLAAGDTVSVAGKMMKVAEFGQLGMGERRAES